MNETSDGKNKTSILYIPTSSGATKKKKKFYKTIWQARNRQRESQQTQRPWTRQQRQRKNHLHEANLRGMYY